MWLQSITSASGTWLENCVVFAVWPCGVFYYCHKAPYLLRARMFT